MSKKLTRDEVIARFRKVHGDKYDYSLMVYEWSDKPVCIICPIHGVFWQRPDNHWKGQGCKLCAIENNPKTSPDTRENFISKAEVVHGVGRYDYSLTDYFDNKTKVKIICHVKDENGKEHGVFEQRPHNHVTLKQGCPKCALETKRKTKRKFIKEARKVHGDKYDYSLVDYYNTDTDVTIICPIHGKFKQRPDHHLKGCGCPSCKQSGMERETGKILEETNIRFTPQCDSSILPWLGRQSLDFYLCDFKVAIECQGIQHYEPVAFFGGERGFKKTVERDKRKKRLCEEHGVRLFYIRYDEDVNVAVKRTIEQITNK